MNFKQFHSPRLLPPSKLLLLTQGNAMTNAFCHLASAIRPIRRLGQPDCLDLWSIPNDTAQLTRVSPHKIILSLSIIVLFLCNCFSVVYSHYFARWRGYGGPRKKDSTKTTMNLPFLQHKYLLQFRSLNIHVFY